MPEDNKPDKPDHLDRREFLGSAATVAGSQLVTSIGAALPPEPAKPSGSFVSRAGNTIPFSRQELLLTEFYVITVVDKGD